MNDAHESPPIWSAGLAEKITGVSARLQRKWREQHQGFVTTAGGSAKFTWSRESLAKLKLMSRLVRLTGGPEPALQMLDDGAGEETIALILHWVRWISDPGPGHQTPDLSCYAAGVPGGPLQLHKRAGDLLASLDQGGVFVDLRVIAHELVADGLASGKPLYPVKAHPQRVAERAEPEAAFADAET